MEARDYLDVELKGLILLPQGREMLVDFLGDFFVAIGQNEPIQIVSSALYRRARVRRGFGIGIV